MARKRTCERFILWRLVDRLVVYDLRMDLRLASVIGGALGFQVGQRPVRRLVRTLMEAPGRLSNLMVARAAFAEAARQRPGARILLRQASRGVMDNGRR